MTPRARIVCVDDHAFLIDGLNARFELEPDMQVVGRLGTADDLAVTVPLRPGWNRVLLHVANLDGGWAFQMRAADPDGALRWSPVPR